MSFSNVVIGVCKKYGTFWSFYPNCSGLGFWFVDDNDKIMYKYIAAFMKRVMGFWIP